MIPRRTRRPKSPNGVIVEGLTVSLLIPNAERTIPNTSQLIAFEDFTMTPETPLKMPSLRFFVIVWSSSITSLSKMVEHHDST